MIYGINPDDLAYDLIRRLAQNDSIHEALPLAIHSTAMEPLPAPIPCSVRITVLKELAEHLKPRSTLSLRKEQP